MRFYGTYRLIGDREATPVRIEAEGTDWDDARTRLVARLPEGCELIHMAANSYEPRAAPPHA